MPDPNDFTKRYNTPIPPDQQTAFNQYAETQKQKTGKDPRRDLYDYDVQGNWLAGAKQYARDPGVAPHGTDQFKKPNEPTFSNESQYNGVDGYLGGSWIDAPGMKPRDPSVDPKKSVPAFYQPSPTNLRFHSQDELQHHFTDPRNGDTNVVLLPPLDIHPPKIDMQPAPSLFRRYYGQK